MQEARAASALNHPNIVTVHDVGTDMGAEFVAMELVDGQPLSDKLTRGGLDVAEVLKYAIQMTDAIAAAHAAGIVHRDLKPTNVMVTAAGSIKILDFGIAKYFGEHTGQTATFTAAHTGVGHIIGTANYMSPEQAEGRPVDARSDIFSFGCVLYEMISGRAPFKRVTQLATLAAIARDEPQGLSAIVDTVPPELERIVTRCLRKDPTRRVQSMADLRVELEDVRDGTWTTAPGQRVSPLAAARGPWFRSWLLATIALLFGAGLAIPAVLLLRRPAETPIWAQAPIRFTVNTSGPVPALSPDGRYLAYVTSASNTPGGIWVRSLAEADARLLPGTAGAINPFWAPDGRAIAFHQDGALKRIDLSGGAAQTLWNVPTGTNGSWGSSGVIVFQLRQVLYQIPATGGTATALTTLDLARQENSHRFPHFLPDGRRFLFVARSGRPENSSVYLASLDGMQPTRLFHALSAVRYAAPG